MANKFHLWSQKYDAITVSREKLNDKFETKCEKKSKNFKLWDEDSVYQLDIVYNFQVEEKI